MDFLKRQLGSIPEREDLEILVIDDLSTDVSIGDWQQFQRDYPYVRLYLTTEAKGAGYARNVGLSHAIGQWVIFADADDFFYPGAFNHLDEWSSSDTDIIYFVCDSRDGTTMVQCNDRMPNIRKFIKERNLDGLRFRSIVPWGKMIKRQLIEDHHLRFDEVEVSNDVMFSMRLGLIVEKVEVLDHVLYCCTKNPDSLAFHKTVDRAKIRLDVYQEANEFLFFHGWDKYRIPFAIGAFPNLKLFWPHHPILFLRYLLKVRYKGHTGLYLRELASLTWANTYCYISQHLGERTKSQLKSIKRVVAKKRTLGFSL